MMLTITAILIGLFALVGINKLSDYDIDIRKLQKEYDEMVRNIEGNKKLLSEAKKEIDKEFQKSD